MSWFQLDPPSLAARAQGTRPPSLVASLMRGIVGFTVVSVAGFLPWGVFGKWFHTHGGELGMYITCAVLFIVLTGLLLHGLIMGKGSLSRFYKLFIIAFTAYSAAWIAGWMILRGNPGSIAGLLAGTVVMGAMFAAAFDAWGEVLKVIAALFIFNAIGYFVGGLFEGPMMHAPELMIAGVKLDKPTQMMVAKMQWALCYGIGFGAGLGIAFYLCQKRARALLA